MVNNINCLSSNIHVSTALCVHFQSNIIYLFYLKYYLNIIEHLSTGFLEAPYSLFKLFITDYCFVFNFRFVCTHCI